MQWLKLHLSLARSPALLTVSLAARGAFFQLFLAANDAGQIDVPSGATHDEVARALLHDPSDETAPTRTLRELTTRGLVVETDDALVVPSRLGIDREGRAVGGVGSRGGRSAAERKRDSRAKRVTGLVTEDVTTPVTGSVTGDVTGSVTGSVTVETVTCHTLSQDTVTGHMATQTLENKALANNVTASVTVGHSSREEKNREEKNREEEGKKKRDGVTGQTVTPPPSIDSLVLSPTESKPKRGKPTPLPDPVPIGGLARQVFDAIVADPVLRTIVEGPGDFANRISDPSAYPSVDVLAEVRRAGEWAARNPGKWNSRAGLASWLRRAAEDVARRPKPLGQAMSTGYRTPVDATGLSPAMADLERRKRERVEREAREAHEAQKKAAGGP